MTIRISAVTYILLTAGFACHASMRADDAARDIDGCAMLASVVFAEVIAARLGSASIDRHDPLHAGRNETTLCNQATRIVTGAFKTALRQSNIDVTWGFHTGYSGDYCLSQILEHCFPAADPAMPPLTREAHAFVMLSWHAVRDSVQFRMAPHPGSDIARFNYHDLRDSIRHSIRRNAIEGQLQTFLN